MNDHKDHVNHTQIIKLSITAAERKEWVGFPEITWTTYYEDPPNHLKVYLYNYKTNV